MAKGSLDPYFHQGYNPRRFEPAGIPQMLSDSLAARVH